jgi:hypothetical protein
MIKAKLLNSEASLNDFFYVGSVEFVPGENVTFALQIFLSEKNIRYIPPVAAELTLTFIDKDGVDVVKTAAVIDADDRSMWSVDLSQAETEVLAGQTVSGELDVNGDGTIIYKFVLQNSLIRINLSGDC